MRFTDKDLPFEPRLIAKIDLMIKRTRKRNADNLIIVEGPEGTGKSNMAAGICYYFSWITGRTYTAGENVFFDPNNMMKYAVDNDEKIIHWDEAAISGLASEWQRKTQKKLVKLLMMARKKKHFYVFCIPKFHKLNEYIIDRAIGVVRVYAARGQHFGRFFYYNTKKKQLLYSSWKAKRRLMYNKYKSWRGRFSLYLEKYKVIDPEVYNAKKEQAIRDLVKDEGMSKHQEQLIKLKYLINSLSGITQKEKAEHFGLNPCTLTEWSHLNEKYPDLVGIEG